MVRLVSVPRFCHREAAMGRDPHVAAAGDKQRFREPRNADRPPRRWRQPADVSRAYDDRRGPFWKLHQAPRGPLRRPKAIEIYAEGGYAHFDKIMNLPYAESLFANFKVDGRLELTKRSALARAFRPSLGARWAFSPLQLDWRGARG